MAMTAARANLLPVVMIILRSGIAQEETKNNVNVEKGYPDAVRCWHGRPLARVNRVPIEHLRPTQGAETYSKTPDRGQSQLSLFHVQIGKIRHLWKEWSRVRNGLIASLGYAVIASSARRGAPDPAQKDPIRLVRMVNQTVS